MDIDSLITALGDVADLINSGHDTDATLRQLIVAACRNGDWLRGSIMSLDLASGFGIVTVRHDPTLQLARPEDQWELATSPSLVALRGNQPVFIRDAQTSRDFPGFRKESRQRSYCSVLVMPMRCTDLLGRPMVLVVSSERTKDLGPTDLSLMKLIVHLGSIAVDKQKAIAEQKNSALQREAVLATHTRLMQQAISDDSVHKLFDVVQQIILQPALAVDLTSNTILVGRTPLPNLLDDMQWSEIVENQLRPRIRRLSFATMQDHRQTPIEFQVAVGSQRVDLLASVYPLRIDGEVVGALVLLGDQESTEYDQLLIASVRLAISVQLMRNLIRLRFERRTLEDLFGEILDGKWKSEKDVAQRAVAFGIRLNRAHRMIVISFEGKEDIVAATFLNIQEGISLLFDRGGSIPIVFGQDDRVVILVPCNSNSADENLRELMLKTAREIGHYTSVEPTLVLSAPCFAIHDYERHWKSCLSILSVAESIERKGIISAEDFGPLANLLSTADMAYVRAFVRSTVGGILSHDRENGTQFFQTLKTYVSVGCRNQHCADELAIHVTTLRYRLTRALDLFGLDLESPAKRFELELALRFSDLFD